VRRGARRLRLGRLECAVRDATRNLEDLGGDGGFDRVLVDAPCSGLGALRRNPDARWRVRPGDPARLAETQLAILGNAAEALGPKGVLVYSTCTLLPEENEGVIESFLSKSRDFALSSPREAPAEVREVMDSDGFMRCLPQRHDTDGFFAARLEKRA
jgi:16S rRNA (cytosine967-C5)-methyltransferase